MDGTRLARIAYILLCHKDVEAVAAKAESLTAPGDFVSIHFDGNSSDAAFGRLKAALAGNERVVFARRRRCGWGEWSLVAATLAALEAAAEAFPRATHFYLMSGDCMPIKTAEYAHAFLDRDDADFLECHDFFESDWIKTGFREERLIYRHWFNERTQARRFYASFRTQRWLKLTRSVPADLKMMIGSQWWCLRRRTAEAVLDFVKARPDVVRFFRTTWIPDETFFQTLVPHLVPRAEIRNRTLTFLMFSDYGMPVTFYDDHYDMLTGQDYLFARKISPEAEDLKSRLGSLYNATGQDVRIADEGRRQHAFLTRRGRFGERYGPRFWEAGTSLGRDRTLLIVTCKKWHVAKRLLDLIGRHSDIRRVAYLFDEEATPLPDLGGIESSLWKRSRHRRAFVRMLFDSFGTDRIILCLDPGNLETIRDFAADKCELRVLEVECDYSDEYLIGHARRVGLAGDNTPGETLASLLPALRNDVARECEKIRDAQFPGYCRISQHGDADENAATLSGFLSLDRAKAREIASADHLFTD